MTRTHLVVLLAPVVLLLAACSPSTPSASEDSPSEPTSVAPTQEAPDEPEEIGLVKADDYLIKGAIGEDPDGDGFWSAHYAFYTDDSHSVRCDLWIFSGDEPGVLCAIAPEARALVTYPLPAGTQCDLSTSNPFDGYSLALGSKGLDEKAGWSGCAEQIDYSDDAVPVKVMVEGSSFVVEPFICSAYKAAASCSYTDSSGTINLGLNAGAYGHGG